MDGGDTRDLPQILEVAIPLVTRLLVKPIGPNLRDLSVSLCVVGHRCQNTGVCCQYQSMPILLNIGHQRQPMD
jgi:hypothetical protein